MDFSNKDIIHVKYSDIEYIQFKRLLDLGIINAYTLRKDTLDYRRTASENEYSYSVLCEKLGIDKSCVTKGFQMHTSNVKSIDRVMSLEELDNTDGLITDKPNIILSTTNADCNLVLMYDSINKVIANVHAGWRGTFQKIVEKAVNKMIKEYGTNPADLICCFCPSIRKCHFEVEEDVKIMCEDIFSYTGRIDEIIEKGKVIDGKQKYYIDTVLINRILLENVGVKDENIVDSNICSVCNGEYINSYRVQKEGFKLSTAIIMKK